MFVEGLLDPGAVLHDQSEGVVAGADLQPLFQQVEEVAGLVLVLVFGTVGIWAALYAENIEPITPLLIVPVFTLVLLPPWAVAGAVVFAASRRIQRMIKREP